MRVFSTWPAMPTKAWLWPLLALPAFGITVSTLMSTDAKAYSMALHPTGEFAARFLVLAMLATPLMVLFKGWRGPRWLLRQRRALGVAAFGYATLHVVFYLIDRGEVSRMLEDLGSVSIWSGWIAWGLFLPLALTSNDRAVRWLGPRWKALQRMTYLAAALVALHWISSDEWKGIGPVLVHFGPLLVLSGYRIWYFNLRARPGLAA